MRGRVSALGWLRGYQPSWLRGDLAAGVTTAAVVFPLSRAYATIAGLPVQMGLYVAMVPMLAYAMLGTSCPLSVSTTSTIAALTAAAVGGAADEDPATALATASALAALPGLLLFLTGLLRLGRARWRPGHRVRHSLRRGSAWALHAAGTWLLPG